MSKHTPGPWRAHTHQSMAEFGHDPKDWIGYAWVGYGGEPDGRFDGMVANLDRRKDASEEWRAQAAVDAYLIAAAPDMLETLKRIANPQFRYSSDEDEDTQLSMRIADARAAIKKAEGKP